VPGGVAGPACRIVRRVTGPDVPTRSARRRRIAHRVAAGAAWAVLVAAVLGWALAEGLSPGEAAARLVDAISGSAWGPLAYLAVWLVRPLAFFPASALAVAGGFLFGAAGGTLLVAIASTASAVAAYGLARWMGAAVPASDDGRLGRRAARLRANGFEAVLVMRLVLVPYDLVSYLAGAARVRLGAFVAATAIGSAPAILAFVLFGASLEDFDGGAPAVRLPLLLASGLLLVAGVALARLLRRRRAGATA
jgi:uncharacterized membrane protein YdjX (TVP38/TMEM64 family)